MSAACRGDRSRNRKPCRGHEQQATPRRGTQEHEYTKQPGGKSTGHERGVPGPRRQRHQARDDRNQVKRRRSIGIGHQDDHSRNGGHGRSQDKPVEARPRGPWPWPSLLAFHFSSPWIVPASHRARRGVRRADAREYSADSTIRASLPLGDTRLRRPAIGEEDRIADGVFRPSGGRGFSSGRSTLTQSRTHPHHLEITTLWSVKNDTASLPCAFRSP